MSAVTGETAQSKLRSLSSPSPGGASLGLTSPRPEGAEPEQRNIYSHSFLFTSEFHKKENDKAFQPRSRPAETQQGIKEASASPQPDEGHRSLDGGEGGGGLTTEEAIRR